MVEYSLTIGEELPRRIRLCSFCSPFFPFLIDRVHITNLCSEDCDSLTTVAVHRSVDATWDLHSASVAGFDDAACLIRRRRETRTLHFAACPSDSLLVGYLRAPLGA